jgi:putative membrane protein
MSENDPRVYFAAERTLLAWVRTGVGLIGLGFVVARFGLFLRLLQPGQPELHRTSTSAWIGIALVISGGVFTLLAGLAFGSFLRALAPEEKSRARLAPILALTLTFAVGSLGLLLGVYLSTTAF